MEALGAFCPAGTAVVDTRFRDALQGLEQSPTDSLGTIRLTSYEPNRLVYETQSAADGVAVFSEIYYPAGWQVAIDGQPPPWPAQIMCSAPCLSPPGNTRWRCASTRRACTSPRASPMPDCRCWPWGRWRPSGWVYGGDGKRPKPEK